MCGEVCDMTRKPKGPVAEIAAAIQGRGKLGHSELYWWMWDHYDQIRNGRHGRADWVTVTENLAKLGLKNKDGSALKVENVRKTYGRVVRDKDAFPPPPKAPTKPQPARTAPPVRLTPAAPTPPTDVDRSLEAIREQMRQSQPWNNPVPKKRGE